ncbi:MAG: TonB-dependent receptor SusC [Candidatus Ordinivivax streblomastigis]|uniref:TonB-dependent receptor SusC n=1 Tax=Candidatus Ordinivivax streblomastigis TaxID=2540710 RepID=A0A5M8P0V6_9BACT|nr:MAG: TonB-dependent receptor SusC [Candidatus Ordinivivax streblomastigis]
MKTVFMKFSLRLVLLFLFISTVTYAQQTKVKGLVSSAEDKESIIGASVTVKGNPSIGTITNIEGKFILNVPVGSKTLVISYFGMKTQEVPVKENVDVLLQPDVQVLGEVVVTGIGKVDKRLFTGASDKLDASTTKIDGIVDISRALEGRSAGVTVQNVSGSFGTAPKIRVRGATSIYGSSKPLWVVDGVVVENITEVSSDDLSSGDAVTLISSAIAGLNSEDIESFQILKDGSATSIYGARAMAGVIVITTKKGRNGVSNISYTGEFTYRLKPNYNEFNIMNSQDQMSVYQEMQNKGWLNFGETFRRSNGGVYRKMYELIKTYDPISYSYALVNTPEARNVYLRQAEIRNTDWFDELFESNLMHNHSLSVSSGNEKSSYYASLSALSDPGWTKQSSVKRYTGNLNVNYNILKDLSINLISMGSYRDQRAPGTLGQSTDPVFGEVKRDFDINPYNYATNSSRALDPHTFYTNNYAPFNILHELDNNYMDLNVVDLKFQGELTWKILKSLSVSGLAALNYKMTGQEHNIKDASNQALAYRAMDDATMRDANPLLYTNPEDPYALPISVLPEGGIFQRKDYRMRSVDLRTTISWVEEFDDKHIINFFGGVERNMTNRNQSYFNGWGMQYSNGEIPFYVYEYFKKSKEEGNAYYSKERTEARMEAYFASLTYSYKGIYSFNATGRYEGSNQMGLSQRARWLPTWNLGLAWNVHEEKFFESMSDVFSHLTLKSSYSLTGSPVPEFISNSTAIITSVVPWRPFASDSEAGLELVDLENSELTYEKKHELNIGAEMGFLDNRISLGFDWYKRNNFDLIGPIATQGAGGQVLKLANIADMAGGGEEISLTTKNIVTKQFDWTTNFIFGKNFTKITRLANNVSVIDLIKGYGFSAQEGYPVRGLYSIPFQGLDEEGIPTFLREDGSISSAADPEIIFQNRDNLSYLKYEGPVDPTSNGSLGNLFRYRNFRLNVFITYSLGNYVRLNPVFKSQYNDLSSMTREFKNRWTLPGDEQYTNVPVILSERQLRRANTELQQTYNAYNYSDIRVAKGDFIRMKEVSLSYDFPKQLIRNVSNLSLKVQATNLFLIYADKKLNGQDPEFVSAGGVAVPVPKQFTFTVRASF